ncbi:MAG: hypothetical protein V3U59_02905 [Gammaproteobacteria bacterium]
MNKDAVQIQFLTFDGCPLAPAAQEVLEKALVQCGLKGRYEVVDIFDAATPARLLAWGSPTILINGRDVDGQTLDEGACCRIYDTPDKVPVINDIVDAIEHALSDETPSDG